MPVMLDDAKLYEVARDARLCCHDPGALKARRQFVLCPNPPGANQTQNSLLSRLFLHSFTYAINLHNRCIDA